MSASEPMDARWLPPTAYASTDLRTGSRRELDGKRLWAFVIDVGVLLPLWIFFAAVLVPRYGDGPGVVAIVSALQLSYYYLAEVTTGQTVGKRVIGLRVVSLDGGLPSSRQAAARTILRMIDHVLIGLFVMLGTGRRRQRLGDIVAATAVVRADAHPVAVRSLTLTGFGYPLAWVAPALVLFVLWTSGHFPATYRASVDEICLEEAAALGPSPDAISIMLGYRRLHSELATVSVPGNWRERHAELTRGVVAEYTLAHEVVVSYRNGDAAGAQRQYGELAATARSDNARLAQLGYQGCAAAGGA